MISKKEMGKRIKHAREIKSDRIGKKYTGLMLADALGVSRGFIGDIENGRTQVPEYMIENLAQALDIPKEYLLVESNTGKALMSAIYEYPHNTSTQYEELQKLTIQEREDLGYSADMHPKVKELVDDMLISTKSMIFVPIPVLGVIRAGEPIRAEQNRIGTEYIPENMAKSGDYFGLLVTGDSMNQAKIHEGDIVIVREQPDVENGEIAVVLVDGENATVKKYYKNDDNVILVPVSTNNNYQPRTYDLKKEYIKVLGKVVKVIVNL